MVHAKRLHFHPVLISAVGNDELGERALRNIAALHIETTMLRRSTKWATGTASVAIDDQGHPTFRILRPAAYDDLHLSSSDLHALRRLQPSWLYYGTLCCAAGEGKSTLLELFRELPEALRFYDVNLRPGSYTPELVRELIAAANVVKLNEFEAKAVSGLLGLPADLESFCRAGAARLGWKAVCVTLGERGCALFDGNEFVTAAAKKVTVADTVGAGDAFAAAFLYGLTEGWIATKIAQFANCVGGLIASRAGALPEWSAIEASTI